MITEVKTEHKSDTLIVILIIIAILLLVGTLIYNAHNRLRYVAAYPNGYGLTALANVPMPYPATVQSPEVYGTATAPVYQPTYQYVQPAQPVYTAAPTYAYVQPAQKVITTKPAAAVSVSTTNTYPSTYYVKTTTTQTTTNPTTVTYPYDYGYNYNNYNTNYGYNNYNGYNYNNGYYNYSASNTVPVITLYGANPYTFYHSGVNCYNYYTSCNQNTSYSEPGFRAYDSEDGDISYKVVTTNNRNNYTYTGQGCQSYTIRYSATDSTGNTGIAERVVNECYGQ